MCGGGVWTEFDFERVFGVIDPLSQERLKVSVEVTSAAFGVDLVGGGRPGGVDREKRRLGRAPRRASPIGETKN